MDKTSHFGNNGAGGLSLYPYLRLPENDNIIHRSGVNWSNIYRVTAEQLEVIKPLLPGRYTVTETVGVGESDLGILINAYEWFDIPGHTPGVTEKHSIIAMLKDAMEHPEKSTGIGPTAYPKLLAKLEALPDVPDIVGFNIHYHH